MRRAVLDVYDDGGALLRDRGHHWAVPIWVKEASDPTSCPDDLFALVASNGDRTIRKYACNDQANTVLSVLYFRENANRLPDGLRKQAARNLLKACTWYHIDPPPFLYKLADVSGTRLAPYSPPSKAEDAARRDLEKGLQSIKTPTGGTEGRVTKMETAKTSSYADPGNRFPLDSIEQIEAANRYMSKYAAELDPRTRRVMALNVYKRATEFRMPVPEEVRELVEVKVASADSIRGHLDARQNLYQGTDVVPLLEQLKEKIGSMRPAVLAETIAQIDETCGGSAFWGSQIPDPWDTVYEKVAEKDPHTYSYDIGTKRVSGDDLVRLSKMDRKSVEDRFGREFAEQFEADPVGFFDHLPVPEKKVLMNMAHDCYAPSFVGPKF